MKKRYIVIPTVTLIIAIVFALAFVILTTPFLENTNFLKGKNMHELIKFEQVQYKITKSQSLLYRILTKYSAVAKFPASFDAADENFYKEGLALAKECLDWHTEKLKRLGVSADEASSNYENDDKKDTYLDYYIPILFMSGQEGKAEAKAAIEQLLEKNDIEDFLHSSVFISSIAENKKSTDEDKQWAMSIAKKQIEASDERIKVELNERYSKSFGALWIK
ncbi:MAG: hypothetical protein RSB11_00875 [Oscillospiraceae bacterium]